MSAVQLFEGPKTMCTFNSSKGHELNPHAFHSEETQGVAIQEAQSSGTIVVATKTGGIPECVEDGSTGFLVEDRNSDAIVKKVEWLMDNHQNWPEWQANARKSVEDNYDINVVGEKLMELYNALVNEHRN